MLNDNVVSITELDPSDEAVESVSLYSRAARPILEMQYEIATRYVRRIAIASWASELSFVVRLGSQKMHTKFVRVAEGYVALRAVVIGMCLCDVGVKLLLVVVGVSARITHVGHTGGWSAWGLQER